MQRSKLLLKSLLSLNLLLLAACNLPTPQSRYSEETTDSGVATFFISDIKGTALKATVEKGSALPQSKIFNFTVCLKDRAQSKALVGHPFRIEQINKDLKTDDKGCLNWSEVVPFNYSSTPRYLEWNRQITATGLHKGRRTAQFAINPWNENDNSEAVVNIEEHRPPSLVSDKEQIQAVLQGYETDKNTTPTSQDGNATPAPGSKSNLWVNDIRMQSTEQKFTYDGVNLNFDLAITPQMLVSTLSGEKMLRDLNQGRFTAKIYLIHSLMDGPKEVRLVIAESEVKTASIRGKSLFIKAPLSLPVIPTRGQLILGLDISSAETTAPLGNFQGVYSIGEYDQLKTAGMLRLLAVVTETKNFQIAGFVNTNLAERLFQHSDAYVKPRIEVMPLEFKYVRVGKETTADREILYNVKACFRNGLEQKTTRGFTFNVTGFRQNDQEKGKTARITTDNSSCINWDDTLSFKYYECQKFIKGYIDIENKELALKQRIDVAINPWESWGTFARDLRYVDAQEQLLTDCKADKVLPSTLSLRSFNFTTLSYGYEIDHQLNMLLKKKLRLRVDAVVSIFSDVAKGRMESAEKLRPGIYLLKGALIKNRDYYNQKSFVSSFEKLVSTVDGDIKTDIEFKTADLKAVGDRNTLLLELDPVQEDKVSIDRDGNITLKNKVNSLDEVIDNSTGLYSRTFSAATNINLEKDAQELTAVDLALTNQYLLQANLPKVSAINKSLVREYINYGKQAEAARIKNQLRQADINSFIKKNGLKPVLTSNPKSYGDLRSILADHPTQMNDQRMQAELNNLINSGKISQELSKGLCAYWFRNFIAKDLSDLDNYHALMNCGLRAGKPESLFTVEKRLFVKELAGYKYKKGYNAGVTVGQNITLTKSQTHSNYRTKSLTFNMGLAHKFADIFSIGMTGSYAISQSDAAAEATANSASVNTNISLVLQQNIFELNLKRYHECAIVKLNPKHFMKRGLFESALHPRLTPEQKVAVATRGLMICTGQESTAPKTREENYYLLTQESTTAQSQDTGDDRNRNFFIALRGEREFQKLMYFMKGEIKTPQSAGRESDALKETKEGLERLFNAGHTNVPGSYNDTN